MKKKLLSILLTLAICVILIPQQPAYANTLDQEKQKQLQINDILQEYGVVSNEERHLKELIGRNIQLNDSERATLTMAPGKRVKFEKDLEKLGLHKIDPNNSNDIKLLDDLSNSTVYANQNSISQNSIPTMAAAAIPPAPDLAALANVFTLFIYDGNYTYNGVSYPYRYIRVVDNKGRNTLYYSTIFNVEPNTQVESTVKAYITYVVQFGLSSFLGSFGPYGAVADFAIGSIWTFLTAPNTKVLASNSYPITTLNMNSTTEMTYYYLYDSSYGWRLIGVDANLTLTRSIFSMANVNGAPWQDLNGPTTSTSQSSWSWFMFIENWVNWKNAGQPGHCQTNALGSITVRGYNQTFTYTPKFVSLPGYL